uniref:TNF family profile domain-containing protein n=1 Tax=Arion vulgaris TaxID=1028688 RepID=A0A0B7B0E7_9EUPU
MENKIHKSSVTRQDSTVLDINLTDSDERLSAAVKTEQIIGIQEQTALLHLVTPIQQNNKHQQNGKEQQLQQISEFHTEVFQPQYQGNSHGTAQTHRYSTEKHIVGGYRTIDEHAPCLTPEPFITRWPGHLNKYSTDPVTKERINSFLDVKDNICNVLCSDWNSTKQSRKDINFCTFNNSIGPNNRIQETKNSLGFQDAKNRQGFRITKNSQGFHEKRLGAYLCLKCVSWPEILIYVVSAFVIVLAVVTVHLHIRVQSLEAADGVAFKSRCRCDQEILDHSINMKSASEDIYTPPFQAYIDHKAETDTNTYDDNTYTDNDNIYTDDDNNYNTDNQDIYEVNEDTSYPADNDIYSQTESEWDLQNGDSLGNSESRQRRDAVPLQSSSKTNIKVVETVASSGSSNSADEIQTSNINVREERAVLSRPARSNSPKKRDKAKNKILRNFCKDCKSQVETFVANFYDIFNFKDHLKTQHITTPENWGPNIQAHRDTTISFTYQNTILPFYKKAQNSTTKGHKGKLVVTNDDKPGVFTVAKKGEYLINLNITIVDSTGQHYLAIFLNGHAMLACNDGGFRCPNTNSENSNKYKVCNMLGVMELHTNDTLDIRTMEDNMTVRLENRRVSYFKIVRLK